MRCALLFLAILAAFFPIDVTNHIAFMHYNVQTMVKGVTK